MLELERKKNIKLALFVVLGVILLILGLFYVGKDDSYFTRSIHLHTDFKNAEGLRKGNNVWLSGVKIGTVTDVRVSSDTSVTAIMKINHREIEFIDSDATVYISSEGIIGNKLIVVVPGSSGVTIEDGAYIASASNAESGDIMSTIKTAGERITALTDDLGKTMNKINEGQGLVGELLNDTVMAMQMKNTIAELERSGANANRITGDVQQILAKAKANKDGAISTLINDTTFARSYEQTLANLKEAGDNSAKISRELAEIVAKIDSGDNSVGVLLSDTVFANNLRRTAANSAGAAKAIQEDAEALQQSWLLRGFFRKRDKEK